MVYLIAKEFKVNLNARTIQRKAKTGDIGTSPVQHGPKGSIPELLHYKNLGMAFESYAVVNWINGIVNECHHKKLVECVHKLLHATMSMRSYKLQPERISQVLAEGYYGCQPQCMQDRECQGHMHSKDKLQKHILVV